MSELAVSWYLTIVRAKDNVALVLSIHFLVDKYSLEHSHTFICIAVQAE